MLTHSRTPDLIVHMELTDVLQYYMGSLFEATGFIFISFSVVISRSIVIPKLQYDQDYVNPLNYHTIRTTTTPETTINSVLSDAKKEWGGGEGRGRWSQRIITSGFNQIGVICNIFIIVFIYQTII